MDVRKLKFSKITEGYETADLAVDISNNIYAKQNADNMAAIAAEKAAMDAAAAAEKQRAIDEKIKADNEANDAYGELLGKKAVLDKAITDASMNELQYYQLMSGTQQQLNAVEAGLINNLNDKNNLVVQKSETVQAANQYIGQTYSVYDTDLREQRAARRHLNQSNRRVNQLRYQVNWCQIM